MEYWELSLLKSKIISSIGSDLKNLYEKIHDIYTKMEDTNKRLDSIEKKITDIHNLLLNNNGINSDNKL